MKHIARPLYLVLVLCFVTACSSSASRGRSLPAGASARAETKVDLAPADAEVWAWNIDVFANAESATLERCVIDVNGAQEPMTIAAGRWTARARLAPSNNVVVARCKTDQGEITSRPVHYVVRLADRPKAQLHATITDGKIVLDGSSSRPGEYSGAPLTRWQWFRSSAMRASSPPSVEHAALEALADGPTAAVPVPVVNGEHQYRLRVTDADEKSDEAGIAVDAMDGTATIRGGSEGPSFLDEAILYGVVPPFLGGPPLRAAADALDSIAALGVTAVWLSPLFGTLPGDFGYAVTDYDHVRADYGTADDLRRFVREAHRLGLRVILDFVPNHTSKQHPYFRQTELLGRRSHYFDFFARDAQGHATHYFDWEHLPNLRYDHLEVGRWMTETASEWINAFGVDGYRVDAAWGITRRNPEFWPKWAAELRRGKPELALIAEASARDVYYATHGFDAAYDWGDDVGQWAWKDVFSSNEGIAERLHEALQRTAQHAARPERVLRFLNNNDTGARFITRHGEDMTRVATALLLTLPGVPCLFMFDEVGAEFEPYAGLGPVRPSPRPALRDFHEKLIRLRRTTPALRGSGFFPLPVASGEETYAFARQGARADDVALVVLHFSASPARVHLTLPRQFGPRRGALRDLLTDRTFKTRGIELDLMLGAWEALILAPTEGRR